MFRRGGDRCYKEGGMLEGVLVILSFGRVSVRSGWVGGISFFGVSEIFLEVRGGGVLGLLVLGIEVFLRDRRSCSFFGLVFCNLLFLRFLGFGFYVFLRG